MRSGQVGIGLEGATLPTWVSLLLSMVQGGACAVGCWGRKSRDILGLENVGVPCALDSETALVGLVPEVSSLTGTDTQDGAWSSETETVEGQELPQQKGCAWDTKPAPRT